MHTPVLITGLGVLAPTGIGRKNFWEALKKGVSGIRPVDRFDASEFPCQIAGQLWDFNPEDFMKRTIVRNWNRHVHQAIACTKLAVADSELDAADYDSERVAVCIGTSIGSPNEGYCEQMKAYEARGYRKVSRYASSAFAGHSAAVHVTIDLGFRGPALTIASGCTTGLDTIAWGMQQIRDNRADAAIVGATESPLFPMSFASACSIGILSKRNDEPEKAMRPFDRHRDGIVLSEGAVALVLERADHAAARGARAMAEVTGNGSASDGTSALMLDPEGKALSRAVEAALQEAGARPGDIDHILSHGVSLEMYDRCETSAYKRTFGDGAYRVPISATKSMTGQAYAAGGLMGVGAALLAIEEGVVAPTINLDAPDPECDLDFVPNRARMNDINTALVSAISFGGTYTATVLQRAS
ncbi:MAG: beta-ketoacyl-[acyl-carrier-protein] synthase II [Nitrospiraceae bacterium]|nr:beta-ketoacyl-[acyl-carrier-protein] synthase II [Nitrospiraceae bacterium]